MQTHTIILKKAHADTQTHSQTDLPTDRHADTQTRNAAVTHLVAAVWPTTVGLHQKLKNRHVPNEREVNLRDVVGPLGPTACQRDGSEGLRVVDWLLVLAQRRCLHVRVNVHQAAHQPTRGPTRGPTVHANEDKGQQNQQPPLDDQLQHAKWLVPSLTWRTLVNRCQRLIHQTHQFLRHSVQCIPATTKQDSRPPSRSAHFSRR
jgi:hypothetical protein